MMVGVFAFSLILGSIVFLLTRWQQTTSVTRIQRSLSMQAQQALTEIMNDVQEASYIYHWTKLDVRIYADGIPGYSVVRPYPLVQEIPAVTSTVFAAAARTAIEASAVKTIAADGLGEVDLDKRLKGVADRPLSTLALASLTEGGLTRPTYVIYFAVEEEDTPDELHHVYRFQFLPNDDPAIDTSADTWHVMNQEYPAQKDSLDTRFLTIVAAPGGNGTIQKADKSLVNGKWQLKKLFTTVNKEPRFVNGLFRLVQYHPWSDLTPISPLVVEAVVVPSQRFGGRIVSFPLFGRAYARNVAMPSAK
jgi:hypothetical protein